MAGARVTDRMLQRLRREALSWPGWRTSVELLKHTRAGCRHWLVVPNAPALGGAQDVTAVGFFGDLRPGMNHSAIYQLEADVVARLGRYAPVGLLGYYDAEIAPALHGNLVIFGTREVPSKWHRDRVHAAAVASAPRQYSVVRLHRGMIRGALLGPGHPANAVFRLQAAARLARAAPARLNLARYLPPSWQSTGGRPIA